MLRAAMLLLCAGAAAFGPPFRSQTLPPPFTNKVGTARWVSAALDWGVISTISLHLHGIAFGNPISYVDKGDGHLYFYISDMDASAQDLAVNASCSLTLSEAAIPGKCNSTASLDPEDPRCARLVFSGTFRKLSSDEVPAVKSAMFSRHPQMAHWPASHAFYFGTLEVSSIWLIDFFGGATDIPPQDYYAYSP